MDRRLLEAHPFLLEGGSDPIVQSNGDNIIAYSSSLQHFVFVDSSGKGLKAINLKDLQANKPASAKVCSVSINYLLGCEYNN